MEVFQPLPVLTSKTKKDIPLTVLQKLFYLWKACFTTARSSVHLSHSISLQFIDTSKAHDVLLPPEVERRFCPNCQVIQLPALTCSIRISKRKSNKVGEARYKNELTIECLLCHRSSRGPGCCPKEAKASPAAVSAAALATPTASPAPGAPPSSKKKHSFLDLLDKGKISTSLGFGGDFVPLSHTSTATATAASSSSSSSASPLEYVPANKRKIDLVELEKSNKKLKRKSLSSGLSPGPSSGLSPSPARPLPGRLSFSGAGAGAGAKTAIVGNKVSIKLGPNSGPSAARPGSQPDSGKKSLQSLQSLFGAQRKL